MLKWLGCLLIIGACGRLGALGKKALIQRRQDLRRVLYGLQGMETEIEYGVNPLPKVLQAAGEQASGAVGRFFYDTGKALEKSRGETLWEIWQKNCLLYQDQLGLNLDDMQLLKSFGRGLGVSDIQDQMRRIGLAKAELHKKLTEAEERLATMGKFWSSLGWGTGVVLVLLWF